MAAYFLTDFVPPTVRNPPTWLILPKEEGGRRKRGRGGFRKRPKLIEQGSGKSSREGQ
jgi:hypothetical protein